jgi:single-strand DNA-binding protein
MITIGIVRIGNEPVIRYTADNKPVLDISLAYNYGRKKPDGSQSTQWVSGTLWGERAEKIVNYLKKGNQILVHLEDLHIDLFTKKDGTAGSKLKARITEIELISNQKAEEPAQAQATTFNDIEDDIPF